MEKHFVTFYSPGTLVAEMDERPIDSWDPALAVKMCQDITQRHGATPYAFRFTTRTRNDDELDSKVTAKSGYYYLGGRIYTLQQIIDRNDLKDSILILNMKDNHYDRVVVNDNSYKWTQPLQEGDVVLDVKVGRHAR